MKSQTKMTITTFSGAAALAFAVGFGGLGASPVTPAPAAHASSSVAPAAPNAPAPSAVHQAILTGCIAGLDC
jgi:hypothetical protein